MKKNYSTPQILWLAGIATLNLIAFANENLTLDQAVREGTDQSPTVQKYESAQEEARWETFSGLSGLLPKIELGAKHDFTAQYESVPVSLGSLTAAVPVVFPRTSFGAEAHWTLFDGLANIRTYEATLSAHEAAKQELSRAEFETRKKIELSFYNALAAQRFEEVAEEDVRTLQENMRQVDLRYKSGRSTQYDVLRVEVQLSDARTELERTQDDVIIRRKQLAQAMGMDEDNRPLSGELPLPKHVELIKGLGTPDIHDRQDFRASELRSQAADQQAKAAAGALIPSLGLSAAYERYEDADYPAEAYAGFRDAWSVGVFLKWSILDGGDTIAKSGAARANADKAAHEYRETVLSMPADYELWRRRYIYSAHHFDSKKEDLKRSEESLRIAELSFQQGRKTITDVLEAETDLFRARAGVVQSQLDAEEALVQLELTFGKEII